MKIGDKIVDAFAWNPLAWLLIALLAFVTYGKYERGTQIARVCTLAGQYKIFRTLPGSAREEFADICGSRLVDAD